MKDRCYIGRLRGLILFLLLASGFVFFHDYDLVFVVHSSIGVAISCSKREIISEEVIPKGEKPLSNPFPFKSKFWPSREKIVRYEPCFPSEKIRKASILLDLSFPSSVVLSTCDYASIDNRQYKDGYEATIECDQLRPTKDSKIKIIENDVVLAYNPTGITFQHDLIDALPSSSFLVQYVLEDSRRILVCQQVVCDILSSLVPKHQIRLRSSLPREYWAKSITVVRNEGLCKPYPFGSFWPVEHFLLKAGFQLPKNPLILFLSRGKGWFQDGVWHGSHRWLDNEQEVVDFFRSRSEALGWGFRFVPHRDIWPKLDLNEASFEKKMMFFQASAVVGLHGGQFSNIVFCNDRAVIIEINNNVDSRNCFPAIALNRGLEYHAFQPETPFKYIGWHGFTLKPKEIRQLWAKTELGVQDNLGKER